MSSDYYSDYEPVFLLDHVEFGSRFRQFIVGSFEVLLQQNRIQETSEEMKFVTLALHVEEMASYEDLGSLLFAIKEKIEGKTPLLKSFFKYETVSVILSKLLAQHDSGPFIQNFHLDELICDETLPLINDIDVAKIRRKIAEIITVDFKKNTRQERIDAYNRMKHGPILMSGATIYSGSKYGQGNASLPGVLLKNNALDAQKKKNIPAEIKDSPFLPFSFNLGPSFRENTFKAVDVSTRIQQFLSIVVLLKFHGDFLTKRSLDKEKLYKKGLRLERFFSELSRN